MKKAFNFIKDKLALVGVVVTATAVGGLATAVVSASIPDSGGTIHGCYSKNGSLKVIDTDAGDTCAASSTALNWSQGGNTSNSQTAYAHITASIDPNGGGIVDGQLDSLRSKNITNVQFVKDTNSGNYEACLTTAFEPENIIVNGSSNFPEDVATRNSNDPNNDGWSSAEADAVCGTNGANAYIGTVGRDTWVLLNS